MFTGRLRRLKGLLPYEKPALANPTKCKAVYEGAGAPIKITMRKFFIDSIPLDSPGVPASS